MEIRVPIFRHLQNLVAKLGLPVPYVIKKEIRPGHAEFVISLDLSNYPVAALSDFVLDNKFFIGKDTHNLTEAEHRAAMAVKDCLQHCFSIQIHDFSYDKTISVKSNVALEADVINSLLTSTPTFLENYKSSIKLMDPFMIQACNSTRPKVSALGQELADLCMSGLNCYDSAEQSVQSIISDVLPALTPSVLHNKEHVVISHVDEMNFLSDILEYLNIPKPIYSTELLNSGKFLTKCSLQFGTNRLSDKEETSTFQGECKSSMHDAESSAAHVAIRKLEQMFKFQVVDFNYDALLTLRAKHDRLVELRLKLQDVLKEAYKAWKEFSVSLHSFVYRLYGLHQSVYLEPDLTDDYGSLRHRN